MLFSLQYKRPRAISEPGNARADHERYEGIRGRQHSPPAAAASVQRQETGEHFSHITTVYTTFIHCIACSYSRGTYKKKVKF